MNSVSRRALLYTPALAALASQAGLAQSGTKKSVLKGALCAYSYRKQLADKSLTYLDLMRIVAESGAAGLDATVYWFPSTEPAFLNSLKREAYVQGVDLYSLSVRTDFCKPAGAEREQQIVEIKKWIDVASHVGAGHIRVFGGNVPKGGDEETTASWVVECLKVAADYAGTRGVILGLENHGGITEKGTRILNIIDRVNSPWLGMNLDTGNFKVDGYKQLQECVGRTRNVQFKEEIKDAEGKAEVADWDRLTRMVAEAGYRGYLAVEYEGKGDATVETPRLLRKISDLARKYSV